MFDRSESTMTDRNRTEPRLRHDVIVVGAGVIGLSIAWSAAGGGLSVCVLERSEPGSGASGVAAGMLAPVGEASFGEEALLELNLSSHAMWPAFSESLQSETGLDTGYLPLGALHVAFDSDEEAEMRRKGDLHRRSGLDSRWLGPDECRELEPGLAPALVGGLFVAGDAAADPRQLVTALKAGVELRGGDLLAGIEPVESRFDDSGVSLTLSDGRVLESERLVLACGAMSGAVAEWLPEHLRAEVRPVKGQILELVAEPPDSHQVAERIVCGERFYAVPRKDGSLALGATVEEKGFDLAITAGAVHELLREGYRALPDLAEMQFVSARAGLRPATPDNAPLIGPSPDQASLLYATGHFRNGVLLAPVTAKIVTALLAGDQPGVELDLDPFRPGRFASRTGSRQGVVG